MPDAPADPAAEVAAFVAGLDDQTLPSEAVRVVERRVTDTVGVILAGLADGVGRTVADLQSAAPGRGEARVLGRGDEVPVTAAAFANATAGHVHDYDDYAQAIVAHPSVVLVPTILAVGDARGAAGTEAVEAFVAGFETECYLGTPVIESLYRAGWFSTPLFGTIGAAAAAARLRSLSADETRTAIEIAAALAAGSLRHNGTTTKPIQVGHAARTGIRAARYAAAGVTAARALTGSGGFYDRHGDVETPLFGPTPSVSEDLALLTDGIHAKKYPCCSDAHTGIAAVQRLVADHDITPAEVVAVEVQVSERALDVLQYHDPETETEAMFSMEHAVASALARPRVGIDEFERDAVEDPTIGALRERVAVEADPDLSYTDLRATVTVQTDRGSFRRVVDRPPGHRDNPMSERERREKFLDCAAYSLDADAARRAYDRLGTLRSRDVPTVIDALVA